MQKSIIIANTLYQLTVAIHIKYLFLKESETDLFVCSETPLLNEIVRGEYIKNIFLDYNAVTICGNMSIEQRNESIKKFKNGDSMVLVATPQSAKEGLTLTGYNTANGINFIYKYSGKNGYIDSEDAMYTNKVAIIPANNSNGKFYIGTKNLFPEPNNMMQYLSLSTTNQYQANPDINNAAQFMIYEYIEKRITLASEIDINSSLCQALRLADKPIVNPKTGLLYLVILTIIVISGVSAYMIRKKESIMEEQTITNIEETNEE